MKKVLISLMLVVLFGSITTAQEVIDFSREGYYPEGVAYYEAEDIFLVGSMTEGEIGAVDKNGNLSTFISDDAIISPIGIKIDNEKQLLYIPNSDIGVSKKTVTTGQGRTSQLLVYDLKTKSKVASYDLTELLGEGYFFANDLTYDKDGNIYVTNSFGPHIWKIDAYGNTSVFANHELFNVEPNHFGLNGIVCHPDGYLMVTHYSKGALYKVPINDPTNVTEIAKSFTAMGADGLELVNDNTLIVVCNNSDNIKLNAAYVLESNDNWESAVTTKVTPLEDAFPTTTTMVESQVYVLYAHLDKMLSGANPASQDFKILSVEY